MRRDVNATRTALCIMQGTDVKQDTEIDIVSEKYGCLTLEEGFGPPIYNVLQVTHSGFFDYVLGRTKRKCENRQYRVHSAIGHVHGAIAHPEIIIAVNAP